MNYLQQIERARLDCDTDIASLPVVIERKLAFYEACHDLALQHGDRHGANNWMQARILALHVRDAAA